MTTLVKMQFGSHVYGTNTPTSDHDYKSIIIPSSRDILLQTTPKVTKQGTKIGTGKNTKDDIDHEIFALHYWFKLLTEGQTLCYDMLFTPDKYFVDPSGTEYPIWNVIQRNRDKLVNSQISAFAGYCQSQAAKYSLKGSNLAAYRNAVEFFKSKPSRMKLEHMRDQIVDGLTNQAVLDAQYNAKTEPLIKFVQIEHKVRGVMEEYLQVGPKTKVPMTAHAGLAVEIFQQQFDKYGERAKQAETNDGVDWKALMHAVRVCQEAKELLLSGHITFPRPEADLLLAIRKGQKHYKEVAEIIVNGLDELKAAQQITRLPEKPDQKWIDDFICQIYEMQIRGKI